MTLWGFIIPGLVLVVTAITAHARCSSYWRAVGWSLAASAVWLIPYFIGLRLYFFPSRPFEWAEPLRCLLFTMIGSSLGAVLAMLIGLVFVADRRIAKRPA